MSKQLTLKEELEILRGEPIQVFTGDPLDIPCIETSDPERLCKHPVVSVYMITYNHEPYIRQAIEGVMMQKTDFEFELVIGEDCSTDKTREICFEYQKRYPDKIRVLWCDHNLYRNPHPAGGNSRRNMAHCRGEFIALCEGDDYWIDSLKLQKQVEVMRKYPNVGLIFCGSKVYFESQRKWDIVKPDDMPGGLINGKKFFFWHVFGLDVRKDRNGVGFVATATTMVRAEVLSLARKRYDVMSYRLSIGDTTLWLAITSLSDAYYLDDIVSVYRRTAMGAVETNGASCYRDGEIVRAYFLTEAARIDPRYFPAKFKLSLWNFVLQNSGFKTCADVLSYLRRCRSGRFVREFVYAPANMIPLVVLFLFRGSMRGRIWVMRYVTYVSRYIPCNRVIQKIVRDARNG